MKKKIPEGAMIRFRLTPAERMLVRDETFYDPDFANLAECEGNGFVVPMTLLDIDELLGDVAAAANHCADKKVQAKLDRFYDKLQRYLDKYEEI
ncbi:MAG: hypothetical protein KJ808_00280 [Acidobacteria bacterium]|nr:hypothetical protein [Acidobacteriota bacterium]MBU4307847.1 hypothetical protein [Acidobacteriota bacterium]MBU4404443.1 hypothetical protein [Acidobacteriota bacterium]MCG2811379.1 hypothetical protein [Candidatus Aminicenantes bacterium]